MTKMFALMIETLINFYCKAVREKYKLKIKK